jgi:hypothetical protein
MEYQNAEKGILQPVKSMPYMSEGGQDLNSYFLLPECHGTTDPTISLNHKSNNTSSQGDTT